MKVLVLTETIQTDMHNEKKSKYRYMLLQRVHSEEEIHLKDEAKMNTAIYIKLPNNLHSTFWIE